VKNKFGFGVTIQRFYKLADEKRVHWVNC